MEQITLNMIPKGITPMCHASQYDKGRHIRLNIMDGLQGYKLTDETAEIRVRKPDNNIVTAAGVYTAGSAYVDLFTTEQMTACDGDNECELRLTRGEQRIGSLNFKMRVEKDPLKDGIESETVIHNLEQEVADLVSEQYDADSVIFDDEPTEGHGIGYAVKSGGLKAYIPKAIDELDDVEINNPQANQAIVYNPITHKFENGEVSTVGSIDDLDDVDTTGKIEGENLRYDGNEWVAKPNTIEMTLAEWNAIADKQAWRNAHKNTYLVITDAPNLNETAKQISYDGGTDTVWDKVEAVNSKYKDYIYEGTNVAVTTSYSSGAMYYANISLPDLDSDKLISVTLMDYGGLSNVLMFQITSKNSFRVWSKTSQTLTTLKARLFYVKSTS